MWANPHQSGRGRASHGYRFENVGSDTPNNLDLITFSKSHGPKVPNYGLIIESKATCFDRVTLVGGHLCAVHCAGDREGRLKDCEHSAQFHGGVIS